MFKDKSFQPDIIPFIPFNQRPFAAVPEISTNAGAASPVQIAVGVLPIANGGRHGYNALVFVIT